MTTLHVLPSIPDEAPHDVREGLTRRALVATGHACPCGASLDLSGLQLEPGTVTTVRVEHEPDCPAVTVNLDAAVRRWKGGHR